MAEFPEYNPLDPEQQDPRLQQLYRPRTLSGGGPAPQAPSSAGDVPDTRGPSLVPRQAEGQDPTRQAPSSYGSWDESKIYKPRYVDVPSDPWADISRAARPGSILSLVGAAAGGRGRDAQMHNEMEHRKYQDSIEAMKNSAEATRWAAVARAQDALSRERDRGGRTTWQDKILQDPDIPVDVKEKLLHGAGPAPKSEVPKELAVYMYGKEQTPENIAAATAAWRQDQKDFNAEKHPEKATPKHAKIPVTIGDQQMTFDPDTGEYSPAKVPPGATGPVNRVGTKQKTDVRSDPSFVRSSMIREYIVKNGSAPDDAALQAINEAAANFARQSGKMPDQRQPAAAPAAPTSQGGQMTSGGGQFKTPEEVKAAVGKSITRDQAKQILQSQFGFK